MGGKNIRNRRRKRKDILIEETERVGKILETKEETLLREKRKQIGESGNLIEESMIVTKKMADKNMIGTRSGEKGKTSEEIVEMTKVMINKKMKQRLSLVN